MSRLRAILEAHVPNAPAGRTPPADAPLRVRPDALVVDPRRGRLALGRFRATTPGPARLEVIAASDRPEAPAWTGGDPDWAAYADLARECGARLVPPRGGDALTIALDGLAAPGRMLAAVGDLAAVGALGTLAWRVGELEAAALMAGEPLEIESRAPLRVQLEGVLPSRVEGHDVACTLLSRWPGVWRGAWVEFQGDGLAGLGVPDRAMIARALSRAGARAVLFPSDDATRAFLRARGRESDWRRTDPAPGDDAPRSLDLGWVVPQALGAGGSGSSALSWWSGAAVGEVRVDRAATYEELARLAALVAGRRVADGVWVSVGPSGEGLARAAEATGLRAALAAAGIGWRRDDEPGRPRRRLDALRLHYGPLPGDADAGDWSASLQACAAAACTGTLEDPHRWPDPRTAPLSEGIIPRPPIPGPLPLAAAGSAPGEGEARPPRSGSSPLCGPVFARWPEDLDGPRLLPAGPQTWAHLDRPERLEADLLPGAPRLASGRGRAPRWVVVQGAIAALDECEAGLLALRECGVRALLGGAVDAASRRRCAEAGLLAMRAAHASDLLEIGPGDELELVGGLDLMALERSRVVRDLTRARALIVVPELDGREWEWVRAGGRFAGARIP